MPKILRFLALQCYNAIAIAQVCVRDVLMLARSLISVPDQGQKGAERMPKILRFVRIL